MSITKREMDILVSLLVEQGLTMGLDPSDLGKVLYKAHLSWVNKSRGETLRTPRYKHSPRVVSANISSFVFGRYMREHETTRQIQNLLNGVKVVDISKVRVIDILNEMEGK